MSFLCLFELMMTLFPEYKKRFAENCSLGKATQHAASESSHGTSCSWVGSEHYSCCDESKCSALLRGIGFSTR
ncbi:unnamed protein product [Musa acuminata subsp. malaccensis]|uniref:(wild Malaysian banana) hypothetical protein n=1 Tax=Musa acuminata subsp. malaccensis TaxID=214687 RepID=A0A804K2Q9_MUSAM|nr:unnamed protein product [Musa acuminata subsp. malaccensis]